MSLGKSKSSLGSDAALEKTKLAQVWELVAACDKNRIDDVRRLIASGVDVDALTSRGTALEVAAKLNHDRVVRLLLEAGAQIVFTPAHHSGAVRTADKGVFAIACSAGADETVDVLVEYFIKRAKKLGSAALEAVNWDGQTVLQELVGAGYERQAIALLKAGADPYHRNDWFECAIETCAGKGLMEVLDFMAQSGVDLSHAREGYTALHAAANANRVEAVQFLVEHGASTRAYYDVVDGGNIPGLSLVMERAMEVYHGITPLLAALNSRSVEAFLYLNQVEGRGVNDPFLGHDLLDLFADDGRARQLILSKRTQLGVMDALFAGNVVESEDSALARLRRSSGPGL